MSLVWASWSLVCNSHIHPKSACGKNTAKGGTIISGDAMSTRNTEQCRGYASGIQSLRNSKSATSYCNCRTILDSIGTDHSSTVFVERLIKGQPLPSDWPLQSLNPGTVHYLKPCILSLSVSVPFPTGPYYPSTLSQCRTFLEVHTCLDRRRLSESQGTSTGNFRNSMGTSTRCQ